MSESFTWVEFDCVVNPPVKKLLLMHIEADVAKGLPSCVVLGYFKQGSNNTCYRVHPGVAVGLDRAVTHWCDCLDDKFTVPDWPGTPF